MLIALGACDGGGGSGPAAPGRVVAVRTSTPEVEGMDTFCEGHAEEAFSWPEAMEGEVSEAHGWRWINVWATWCRPCVDEMPRLVRFQEQLQHEGISVELVFLSADTDAEAVQRFHEEHPAHAAGPRVGTTEALRAWLGLFGLGADAPLPVHLFVNPEGRVVCARTAAMGDDDYASVKGLLTAP